MVGDAPKFRIKAVLGLGNPGRRYSETRHNFGYMVVDRLAFLKREEFRTGGGPFIYCRASIAGEQLFLCKSTTYMNNSGKAAIALKSHFNLSPAEILVVSDDCNLKLGKIRYRPTGSDGGHNGLASIIKALQSKEFPRLRLGINECPDGVPLEDYVLENFSRQEFEIVDQVIVSAIGIIERLMADDIENKSVTLTVAD